MIRLRHSIAAAAAIAALGSFGVAFAQSETLYVVEQVTVSVNATADGSGERVAQIKSGDKVEVLEHSGDQARVKIPTGEEGWVRSSYLSPARPVREQLKSSNDELERLRQENSKLEAQLASAKKAAALAASSPAPVAAPSATSDVSAAAGSAPSARAPVGVANVDPRPSNPPLFADAGVLPSRPSWISALAAAVVALGAGFALGWRMLDRRIRAKYGGLRIY